MDCRIALLCAPRTCGGNPKTGSEDGDARIRSDAAGSGKIPRGRTERPRCGMTLAEFVVRLESRGCKVRVEGDHYRSQCPVHPGGWNMTIRDREGGGVVVLCKSHACSVNKIVEALGLTLQDIFSANGQ